MPEKYTERMFVRNSNNVGLLAGFRAYVDLGKTYEYAVLKAISGENVTYTIGIHISGKWK